VPHRGRRRVFFFGLGWHSATRPQTLQSSLWRLLEAPRNHSSPRSSAHNTQRAPSHSLARRCCCKVPTANAACVSLSVSLSLSLHSMPCTRTHPRTQYFARSRHTLLPGSAQRMSLSLCLRLCLSKSLSVSHYLSLSLFISLYLSFSICHSLPPRRASHSVSLPHSLSPSPAPHLHPVPAQHLHPFQGRDVDTDHP
jgi:hypothetical protein